MKIREQAKARAAESFEIFSFKMECLKDDVTADPIYSQDIWTEYQRWRKKYRLKPSVYRYRSFSKVLGGERVVVWNPKIEGTQRAIVGKRLRSV